MKLQILLPLALLSFASAQDATPPAEPVKPKLTPEQVKNVLTQLEALEKSIMQQRGTDLAGIIKTLRSAASSDAACVNLIADCDKLVNVELKDGDRKDAQRIDQKKTAEKRGETKKDEEKDGDHVTGLRLCLDYLALTLEAHDVKDVTSMIPKLQEFHQTLIAHGKKLRGRTGEMLMRGLGGGGGGRRGGELDVGVVIQAYNLDPFLKRENWPQKPGDIIDAYDKLILVPLREKKKDDLPAVWDTAILAETTLRKERLPEGELKVWQVQEYPQLRWKRAGDLTTNGSDAVKGMAEMMKVIKEFPSNPHSPEWVKELRNLVTQGLPSAPTDEKPVTQ